MFVCETAVMCPIGATNHLITYTSLTLDVQFK